MPPRANPTTLELNTSMQYDKFSWIIVRTYIKCIF
jgi:hypothetical protein